MTRSRQRKIRRDQAALPQRPQFRSASVALAVMAVLSGAAGAQEQAGATLEEVIVTAQKREESLQNVPLSIQALGTAKLEELGIGGFDDYARLLPSVSFQGGGQGYGPGFMRVYMRGVAAGDNGNHSGPRPSVGMYLDEQPITTIQGALDIRIYDIARVESLAGPQGTLYGASSQSGTIRIITNKPDPAGFAAGYDVQAADTENGSTGYSLEGFVNLPLSDTAAVRLVGWTDHKPGYIDNVEGEITYPSTGITVDNAGYVRNHYNDVVTTGGRAALALNLGDSWTITPSVIGQNTETHGSFGMQSDLGDLQVAHYHPETTRDRWYQAALTVQGRISNFDLVYAGAYLHRNDEAQQDYADYSFFYDSCCGYFSSDTVFDNAGNAIDPTQFIQQKDRYRTQSHELRVSSPRDWRLRFVAGLFYQEQKHNIEQRYVINDIATSLEVTGWPDTWWLTKQERVDRDSALFTELNFDVTDRLVLTGGIRFFDAKNTLQGFFGFGKTNEFSGTGEKKCFAPPVVEGAPCTNLDREVKESGNTPKLSLSYRITDDHMVYATWSKGFRPGGTNRRDSSNGVPLPPYTADYLKNYEVGWKTTWLDNRLRFNGAVFYEDWQDFQFSYLGTNALTEIRNAGGAKIPGIEAYVDWAAMEGLSLSAGVTYLEPKLSEDFCKNLDASGRPLPRGECPADFFAPDGTSLPVTPKFKGNITGRYNLRTGGYNSFLQATYSYQTSAPAALIPNERTYLRDQAGYGIADFSAGIDEDSWSVEMFVNNIFDERADVYRWAQCPVFQPGTGDTTPYSATVVCGERSYTQTNLPRTFGVRFAQRF